MQQPGVMQFAIPAPPREPPDSHEVHKLYFIGFIILYIVVILPTISGHWFNIIFYPLTFLTAGCILLYYNNRVNQQFLNPVAVKFADLFRAFGLTFYAAGILALVFEIWIQLVVMLLLIAPGAIIPKLASTAKNGGNPLQDCANVKAHIYSFMNAFFVAALVEESLKAFIIQHCIKRFLPYKDYLGHADVRSVVWIGMAVGLGFGTVEGVMYVCIYGYMAGQSFLGIAITWLIRDVIAIPFHTCTGLMWGIGFAKRDCLKETISWPMLYLFPWLFHGIYDFIEMEYSVCETAHTIGVALGGLLIAVLIEILAGIFVYFQLNNLYLQASQERVPDEDPMMN